MNCLQTSKGDRCPGSGLGGPSADHRLPFSPRWVAAAEMEPDDGCRMAGCQACIRLEGNGSEACHCVAHHSRRVGKEPSNGFVARLQATAGDA